MSQSIPRPQVMVNDNSHFENSQWISTETWMLKAMIRARKARFESIAAHATIFGLVSITVSQTTALH